MCIRDRGDLPMGEAFMAGAKKNAFATAGNATALTGYAAKGIRGLLTGPDAFIRAALLRASMGESYMLKVLDGSTDLAHIKAKSKSYQLKDWANVDGEALVDSYKKSIDLGNEIVLTRKPDGDISSGLMKADSALRSIDYAGRVYGFSSKFLNVAINQAVLFADHVPGLAHYSNKVNLNSADPAVAGKAKARMYTGSFMIGSGAILTHQGVLQGPLSKDRALAQQQRKLGVKANSLKIGDTYIPLKFLGVPGLLVSTGAYAHSLVEQFSRYAESQGKFDSDEVGMIAGTIMSAFTEFIMPTQFTGGITDLVNAFDTGDDGKMKAFRRYAAKQSVNAIPLKSVVSLADRLATMSGRPVSHFIDSKGNPNVSHINSEFKKEIIRAFPSAAKALSELRPDVDMFGTDVEGAKSGAKNFDIYTEMLTLDNEIQGVANPSNSGFIKSITAPLQPSISINGIDTELDAVEFHKMQKYARGYDELGNPLNKVRGGVDTEIRKLIKSGYRGVAGANSTTRKPSTNAKRQAIRDIIDKHKAIGLAKFKREFLRNKENRAENKKSIRKKNSVNRPVDNKVKVRN